MHGLLAQDGAYGDLQDLDGSIPMPHMPHIRVKGLIAEKTKVFKSALCPFVLTFIVDDVPAAVNEAREIQKTLIDGETGDPITDPTTSTSNTTLNSTGQGQGRDPPKGHSQLTKRDTIYDEDPSKPPADKEAKVLKVMMKIGDDLRQDQLIMQLVQLMDTILMRVNLDLKLTP